MYVLIIVDIFIMGLTVESQKKMQGTVPSSTFQYYHAFLLHIIFFDCLKVCLPERSVVLATSSSATASPNPVQSSASVRRLRIARSIMRWARVLSFKYPQLLYATTNLSVQSSAGDTIAFPKQIDS